MAEVKTAPVPIAELQPRWVRNDAGLIFGITYACPCRAEDCPIGGRCIVPTRSNFTGEAMQPEALARGWDLTGTSWADISLSPSIFHRGHWHGWLVAGVLESC